ncbi:MAG: ribokinase [Bacteroidota bacterium]
MSNILIVGSSNTDMIAKVENFPQPGETIHGLTYMEAMGGKGANQAIAANRLGGQVRFITCLGDDPNGRTTLDYYRNENLDVSASRIVRGVPSGTAMILVDGQGENCIVVTPGANHELKPDYIWQIEEEISEANLVLMQMEIPCETVKTVSAICKKYHIQLFLNVAPAKQLDDELIRAVDVLIVNETEAEMITGEEIEVVGKEGIVDRLRVMGATTVVLTLGKEGCYFKNDKESFCTPAFEVDAVDTTAAGDTFCGALVTEISKGSNLKDAVRFASAASAITVTKMGAQPSIPTAEEVLRFLQAYDEKQPVEHSI